MTATGISQIVPARAGRTYWRPDLRKLGLMDRDKTSAAASAELAEEMAALLAAIANDGDRTAFARLFGHYAPRVKSYLRRLHVEERQAEDIAQDVMLTVWRKAGQFDPAKASAGTWIFTIARNRFIDTVRRERRPALDPDEPMLLPEAPRPADDSMAAGQIGARVHQAMSALPPDQAEVVALSFLEGLPHSAIAERLDIPLGTVKSRLRLAFGRLRAVLEDLQ
ncbi:MAG: sigma-70 family RNA polymerase sigma factor [Parvibaculum sp.]|nr:sigma-70 family RNA polymerase sigma factor [Parvibaculum sp.]